MPLTVCRNACSAVGRAIGSGLRRDLMKSLAETDEIQVGLKCKKYLRQRHSSSNVRGIQCEPL